MKSFIHLYITSNKLIDSTKDKIFAYIDIQAHCKKKCSYLYGPEFPLHDQNYFKVRVLPKILDSLSDHFRFHSCAFHVNKHNERTARVILFRNFDINLCYVFGASFQGYLNKERKNQEFTLEKYQQIGETLCRGLCLLSKSLTQQEAIQHNFLKTIKKRNTKISSIAKQITSNRMNNLNTKENK